MIIGTAGHIDHGKTTLVKALTGVDTDRLKEEKERGISIELGYAYTPLPSGEVLGFIDVPGHERLVHTMVAGACGIDFALLVIAADDGIMPQTREHLSILELLAVGRGAVALSKADRVDRARLSEVQSDITKLLTNTSLEGAPIFPVNATVADDPGTLSLRSHLHAAAASRIARPEGKLFRLAVDRVFSLIGRGTIVTGTVCAGQVRASDVVKVMPADLAVRVRSLHAHNRAAQVASAGERCALNLAGIETQALSRGDWLAAPGLLAPTTRVDVRLRLLAAAPLRRLAPWAPLHVHLGTAHQVARVVLLEAEQMLAGESARIQLVFDTPVCTVPGDRFIVRDAQAAHTIGGGVVLDPFAPSRRRRSVQRLAHLQALERLAAGEGIGPLLDEAAHGLTLGSLVQLTGISSDLLSLPSGTVTIDCEHDERFVLHLRHRTALRERALEALKRFHGEAPEEPGVDIGRLRRMAAPELPGALWRALIGELVREELVMRRGAWLHLPEHAVSLSAEDQTLAEKLSPLIAAGRFDPPWVRELAALAHQPEQRVREVLRKAVTQGTVYQVVRDLFYDRECIAELAAIIGQLAHEHGAVSAARYRDAIGLGRKRAIQILEFFDRVGYTRRIRDTHVLRHESGWGASR
jgi:selenocysteine-specific elongation factor